MLLKNWWFHVENWDIKISFQNLLTFSSCSSLVEYRSGWSCDCNFLKILAKFFKSISKFLGCCIKSKKFVLLGGAHSTLHWWQCIEWLVSWSVEQLQHGETSNNLGVQGNLSRGIENKTVQIVYLCSLLSNTHFVT